MLLPEILQVGFYILPQRKILLIIEFRVIGYFLPVTPMINIGKPQSLYRGNIVHKYFDFRQFVLIGYIQMKNRIGTFDHDLPRLVYSSHNVPPLFRMLSWYYKWGKKTTTNSCMSIPLHNQNVG